MVTYGSRPRSRHYKSVKAEHKEFAEQTQSPFVPVADTTAAPSAQRSSMDVTTSLPLKERKEGDVVVKPEAKSSDDETGKSPYQPAAYSEKTTNTAVSTIPVANTVDTSKPATFYAKPLPLRPEDVVTTEGSWFNNEAMVTYGSRPRRRHYKSVKAEHKELAEQTQAKSSDEIGESKGPADIVSTAANAISEAAWDIAGKATSAIASTTEDAKEEAPVAAAKEEETPEAAAARIAAVAASTVRTEDRWFNSEKRDFFRPAQKHIPYTISNPEYHQSPNMMSADAELSSASPSTGAFVNVSYNPAAAAPTATESEATEPAPATETPAASAAPVVPKVAAELIPLTTTTDQKWFNAESKGTYFSGVRDVREHKPYTIRNPEYHRSPNMMRAEQETSAASPSAGAYVSVSWNPPPAPAAPTTTATESSSKSDETPAAASVDAVQPAPEVATELPKSVTTMTDDKWFNAESKGTYASGVKDVRQHTPYQLIPKGSDEASIRTSS